MSKEHLKPYQFVKGNPGRSPGPNKLTIFIREVLGGTFNAIGGPEAFAEWAAKNRTDFYTKLWIKLLPDSSQLSEDERERVLDAMLGIPKVLMQVYDGQEIERQEKGTEVTPVVPSPPPSDASVASQEGRQDVISPKSIPAPPPG